jgi:hypothetical protein
MPVPVALQQIIKDSGLHMPVFGFEWFPKFVFCQICGSPIFSFMNKMRRSGMWNRSVTFPSLKLCQFCLSIHSIIYSFNLLFYILILKIIHCFHSFIILHCKTTNGIFLISSLFPAIFFFHLASFSFTIHTNKYLFMKGIILPRMA